MPEFSSVRQSEPHQRREVVTKSLCGQEGHGRPFKTDVLQCQGVRCPRAHQVVVLPAFRTVRVVGEMGRTRDTNEGTANLFQHVLFHYSQYALQHRFGFRVRIDPDCYVIRRGRGCDLQLDRYTSDQRIREPSLVFEAGSLISVYHAVPVRVIEPVTDASGYDLCQASECTLVYSQFDHRNL